LLKSQKVKRKFSSQPWMGKGRSIEFHIVETLYRNYFGQIVETLYRNYFGQIVETLYRNYFGQIVEPLFRNYFGQVIETLRRPPWDSGTG
jgi:hypothetical protein